VRGLVDRRNLTRIEAAAAMDAIMTGAATNAQIAAFLTALRMKGETVEELIGLAQVMRQKAVRVRTRGDEVDAALTGTDREMLIDTCGTGGDATGTFNVSTATAFVVAGAGLRVAKHGNRSVSSLCGSADVVETLGISLELPPDKVTRCIEEVGIGFLYAPLLHTAMKHVMPARREMGVRTVFNMLGPLTNPAAANAQIIGVYAASLTEPLARVLAELGTVRAFVVHGADNLDEISNTGESRVSEVREGAVRTYVVRPEDFGPARKKRPRSQGRMSAVEQAAVLSEAARPLGADREPFARSPSQRSKRRTGSGHPRFPGVSGGRRRRSCKALPTARCFLALSLQSAPGSPSCGPPRPAVQCAHIRRRANSLSSLLLFAPLGARRRR